jgi:hypothetical protein
LAIRPILIDKRSPFLGEACALCKEPFAPGDDVVVCPEDATRHHSRCWAANGNRCTAYGCQGKGIAIPIRPAPTPARIRRSAAGTVESKVQTLPTRSFSCAQSCLLLAVAIAIVLFAIACFGLWALADYVATDVLGWQYRGALPAVIWLAGPMVSAKLHAS